VVLLRSVRVGPVWLGVFRLAVLRLAIATLVVGLSAVVLVRSAHGGAKTASAHVVATAGCPGADNAAAPLAVKRRAIVCLVNRARRQANLRALSTPPRLRRAAVLKGRHVAICRQLSHTPCGTPSTNAVRLSGYRYGWFGENLYAAGWGRSTPRSVVAAWLASPGHRANLLQASFRHLGTAVVRAPRLLGTDAVAVWVIEFASPR
jgi:uncharacterized protein YkwD